MRTMDDEINYREEQRRRYFEDPDYRKWSDVVPNDDDYGEWRDDVLFVEYVTNEDIEKHRVHTCTSYSKMVENCLLTGRIFTPI